MFNGFGYWMKDLDKIMVGIIMGSRSDEFKMRPAADILELFQIPFDATIASAHRTEEDVGVFMSECEKRGCLVFIGGAGLAAHLPGVMAAKTIRPVIGIPLTSSSNSINGLDSLLSIVQMPKGIPVGTVGIDIAANAAYLAAQIIATSSEEVARRIKAERLKKAGEIRESNTEFWFTEHKEA